MRYVLKLEAIGDNYAAALKHGDLTMTELTGRMRMRREIDALRFGQKHLRPWVAKLTGLDNKFGFMREFIKPQRDYSQANPVGNRGVFCYYPLKPGLYEVNERLTWKRTRRYFLRVNDDATAVEINRDEVEQCLQSADSASMS